jgi:hypothetical protein
MVPKDIYKNQMIREKIEIKREEVAVMDQKNNKYFDPFEPVGRDYGKKQKKRKNKNRRDFFLIIIIICIIVLGICYIKFLL